MVSSKIKRVSQQAVNKRIKKLKEKGLLTTEFTTESKNVEDEVGVKKHSQLLPQNHIGQNLQPLQPEIDGSDLMREGYRGTDSEPGSGWKPGSITADLNTLKEDLSGQKPQDPTVREDEAMAAAETSENINNVRVIYNIL